jgi:BolA family transcriptional regulator, general stress-responsive regulator
MAGGTMEEIERRLRESLDPVALAVVDDSARHAGHAGAASGGGHYNLRVVSSRFQGMNRVARHRLVYHSLSDLMRNAVHALAIEALTPEENSETGVDVRPAHGGS